ncbi:MAG TPA: serine hydrolase [Microlunatus sp.]|nr:serine hydrolase [Microlunatus sp.]
MSFDVLGHHIELVTEEPLGQFLGREIFEPLGMVDIGFSVPAGAMDRFGPLYGPRPVGRPRLGGGTAGCRSRPPPEPRHRVALARFRSPVRGLRTILAER